MEARFERVSAEEHADRLASYGFPPHIVTATTELVEALQCEEDAMTSQKHIQPREVSIEPKSGARDIDRTIVYPSWVQTD
jgi:hypothetical protein